MNHDEFNTSSTRLRALFPHRSGAYIRHVLSNAEAALDQADTEQAKAEGLARMWLERGGAPD